MACCRWLAGLGFIARTENCLRSILAWSPLRSWFLYSIYFKVTWTVVNHTAVICTIKCENNPATSWQMKSSLALMGRMNRYRSWNCGQLGQNSVLAYTRSLFSHRRQLWIPVWVPCISPFILVRRLKGVTPRWPLKIRSSSPDSLSLTRKYVWRREDFILRVRTSTNDGFPQLSNSVIFNCFCLTDKKGHA